MKREPIGTVLVGPSALLREGPARILNAAGFRVLAPASGVEEPVLNSLPPEQSILLVIDVSDHFDVALEQIESFKKRYPAGRVVMLTQQRQTTEMVSALRVGANAYLVKVATSDTFVKSLELVMLGMTLFPSEMLTFISGQQDRSRAGAAGRDGHAAHDQGAPDHGRADDDDDHPIDDGEMAGTKVGATEPVRQARTGPTPRTQAAIWAMNAGPFMSVDDTSPVLGKLPADRSTVWMSHKSYLPGASTN